MTAGPSGRWCAETTTGPTALRELGAEVVVGDLTNPQDVANAMAGVDRMFFNMSVSPDYLTATSIVCAVALEAAPVEVIVNMSQMTVSQMTLTSTSESKQHRLHWLAEHIMNWSGVPVVHVRPTVFMENPLLTMLAADSIRERGALVLPFGNGRTSPIAAADVARVVAAVLRDPAGRVGAVYELTGPEVLDVDGIAEQYSRALGRPVTAEDIPLDKWTEQVLAPIGLPPHVAAAHRHHGAATPRGPLRPQHRRRRADHRHPSANGGAVRGRARRRV